MRICVSCGGSYLDRDFPSPAARICRMCQAEAAGMDVNVLPPLCSVCGKERVLTWQDSYCAGCNIDILLATIGEDEQTSV